MFVPALAVAPVLVTDFPVFVGIRRAGFEADELFILGDMKPELHEHCAVINEHFFKFVDLPIRTLPGSLGAKALDPLDKHAAIP